MHMALVEETFSQLQRDFISIHIFFLISDSSSFNQLKPERERGSMYVDAVHGLLVNIPKMPIFMCQVWVK